MHKDSKIYVAGHRGLVGSAIMRKLLDEGFQNLVLRTHGELDLTDRGAVNRFFKDEKPEYIFLAAAKVGGIYANDTYPVDFILENVRIQNNVIESSWEYGVKRLLFLGSSCIYPKHAPQPLKEEYLLSGHLEPTNEPYAIAKIAGIKLCEAFNRQYGTMFLSVMPTNLYGPNDNYDLETSHVLPSLIRKFHLAKLASQGNFDDIAGDEKRYGTIPEDVLARLAAIARRHGHTAPPAMTARAAVYPQAAPAVALWGSGSPRREFLYVDDLADACVFLMQNYDTGGVINIGVGEDLTIKELAAIVAEAVDFEGSIAFDSAKPDGTPRKLLDVSRIQSLGWTPRTSLPEGIGRAYEGYRENK